MGQFDSLIFAAQKGIKSLDEITQKEDVTFNTVYKKYKNVQTLWFRIVEEASENNSKRLEEVCVSLEAALARCSEWIQANSPTTHQNAETEEM